MINASLGSLLTGSIKPDVRQVVYGTEYFAFRNGQIRRQVGQGHSRDERLARKAARRLRERSGARLAPVHVIAAGMLAQHYRGGRP